MNTYEIQKRIKLSAFVQKYYSEIHYVIYNVASKHFFILIWLLYPKVVHHCANGYYAVMCMNYMCRQWYVFKMYSDIVEVVYLVMAVEG